VQHDTLRNFAGGNHPPEFDEEFSRERDDHGGLARTVVGSRAVPLSERAIFLILQKSPRQLDHAAAHASVAGFWGLAHFW
jgi:hypothetical protein